MAVKFVASIKRWIGLSTDTKPTGVPVGSKFFESNTRATYVAVASIEDFGTYNKTDPSGVSRLSSDGAKIKLINGERDQDYYRTKDFGVDCFGDLTHWVDVNVTALTSNPDSAFVVWGLSNADDDFNDIDIANGSSLFLWMQRLSAATTYFFRLYDLTTGTLTSIDASVGIAVNTESFLAITRSGTTWTAEIYSSATLRTTGGGGDVDTISGTSNSTAYRYVYGLGSYNKGLAGRDISGTVSNLIINEAGASFWSKI